jgi:hypothetical protein
MLILTSLFGKRVQVSIIAVVLAWGFISLSALRVHAVVDPGTVITALKTAYSLFQAGKSLFDHSPSLETLLDAAMQTAIEQIRDQELQALVESLQDRYKEISRHKGDSLTESRLQISSMIHPMFFPASNTLSRRATKRTPRQLTSSYRLST